MRERCPVAHSEFLNWSIFRNGDIVRIVNDPETFSSETKRRAVPNGMDPPDHTRFRRALEPFFTAERMADLEPHCRKIATDLAANILQHDEVDFVSAYADPFSLKSHCAFLGWNPDRWEQLIGWTHRNQQATLSRDREAGKSLALAFIGYVNDELAVRRQAGVEARDDVMTGLMQADVDGRTMSDDEIASALRNWTAGHGTVSAGIALVTLHLAQHGDLQQQLRQSPELLPAAIDEILRVDGPLVSNRRTTTREVTIGERTIPANENLNLMWMAANRDWRAFDDPETVRLDRDPADNLLFGRGIHDCVGAPLARLELRVAIEELLTRSHQFELGSGGQPVRAAFPGNGLQSMSLRVS